MGSEASILWSVLFGAIGIGYFVSNAWAMVLVGAALMAVPYFVEL